jgi:trimeric autotransporter adhesin
MPDLPTSSLLGRKRSHNTQAPRSWFSQSVWLSLILLVSLARAGHPQGLDANLWITNGVVNSIVRDGGTIYLGGAFDYVGPSTGGGVPLNLSNGALPPSFPVVEGYLLAVISDGAGGWYIGGDFDEVGGLPRSNLAHIASDFTVTAWSPDPNGLVNQLLLSGGTLYVGGSFTAIAGQTRNFIAAFNATTGALTSWNPNANGSVWALATSGSTVYVGGYFTNIGGQTRNRIAALDATTGAATSWNPNVLGAPYPSTYVLTILVDGGTVYAGGQFTSAGGASRTNLAALDAVTGAATSWNPGANAEVRDLVISGSNILVCGRFTTIAGVTRNHIAAVRSNGSATSWDPNTNDWIFDLFVSGGTVYMGGNFTTVGGQSRNRIAAVDAGTGNPTAWNPGTSGSVYRMAIGGSWLYAGGTFVSAGGVTRGNLAALNAATGTATSWDPQVNGAVNALALSGNDLYVGGTFTSIGVSNLRNNLAVVSVSSGNPGVWNPSPNGAVKALGVSNGKLFVGGVFTTISGQGRNRIAEFQVPNGLLTAWNPTCDGEVRAIALSDSRLYIGGAFSNVGPYVRAGTAAFNRIDGSVIATWDTGTFGNQVAALALEGSSLYVGGTFSVLGGESRNNLAALDASTGTALSWDPSPNAPVKALTVTGDVVYVGGEFTTIAGVSRPYLAAIDTWFASTQPWDSKASYIVYSVAPGGGKVYASGYFAYLGGQRHPYFGAVFAAPQLQSITPSTGGNTGKVTATLAGYDLQSGSTARLERGSEGPIVGTGVQVSSDLRSLTATFDLTGAQTGDWNVFVETPDLQTATIENRGGDFLVQALAAPQLRVSIVGQDAIRAGFATGFDLVIENPGNVDALAVPLWVTGIPAGATVGLDFALTPPPQAGGEPDWSTVPRLFTGSSGQYLPLVIPRVPPGATSRRITLSVPTSGTTFTLGAAIAPTWSGSGFAGCLSTDGVIGNPTCASTQLDAIYGATSLQAEALSGTGTWAKVAFQCEGAGSLALAIAKSEQILDDLEGAIEGGPVAPSCQDFLSPRWRGVLAVSVVSSIDPNDKLSPQGPVSSQQAIPYSIRFENLASAGASAQRVIVTDALAQSLDLATFTLGAVTFGSYHLNPPPGAQQFSWDVDLGPTKGIIVRVVAGFTPYTPFDRTLVWSFTSLDRTTRQPLDPASLNGFLPPNLNPPEGEGSVLFTIKPTAQTPNGTVIQNGATIAFDGATLNTPPVSNTLDNQPPTSNVLALGNPISDPSFTVNWQGNGDGLRDYTIYVAEDGGPYQSWKLNTTTTSGAFSPKPGGHTYGFYSVARDMSGNIEPAPTTSDAQTISTTSVDAPRSSALALFGTQPNPARGVFRVGFALATRSPATLELIDVAGRRVFTREVGEMGPGRHEIQVSSPRFQSGLYFLRLVQEGHAVETRVVLTK